MHIPKLFQDRELNRVRPLLGDDHLSLAGYFGFRYGPILLFSMTRRTRASIVVQPQVGLKQAREEMQVVREGHTEGISSWRTAGGIIGS